MSTDAPLSPDPAQLPDDVEVLKALILQLFATVEHGRRRIAQLEQHLHLLVKRFMRPASEKLDPRQRALFTAEELAALFPTQPEVLPPDNAPTAPLEQKPRKHTPHGRRPTPDTMEREVRVHDLTDAQKQALGGEKNLAYIGEDVTNNYEWRPSSVLVIEHHQKKYVRRENEPATDERSPGQPAQQPPSECSPAARPSSLEQSSREQPLSKSPSHEPLAAESIERGESQASCPSFPTIAQLPPELAARFSSNVIVAPKPAMPIAGGMAGPGLLAQVIVSKYGDHLPLHRLERIFARHGAHFTRQTMCDWCAGCATLLRPLTELIRDEVLASFVIHTDDTPVDVRDAHRKLQFQARFWSYLGDETHPLTWFEFTSNRQRAGPDRVLASFRGYLQADGYGGYDDYEGVALGDDSPILKVACWAHARRKFHDALRTELKTAQIALAYIGQLYALEKSLRKRVQGEWQTMAPETRAGLIAAERQACAKPVLDKFKAWLEEQALHALPKSPIFAAVRYARNQWDALYRYIEDGRLAIDNNAAERALRGIAIGRKNWLFCGSEEGGRTAAVMFTLISSAVRNKLDPWAYLRDVFTRLAALRDSASALGRPWKPSRDDLLPLLPDRWQPAPENRSATPRA